MLLLGPARAAGRLPYDNAGYADLFIYDRDIRVSGTRLWLDARRKKELSFVSHAHADHAARHTEILATPATLALADERRRLRRRHMKRPPKHEPAGTPLDFGKPLDVDGAVVTLFPAGHILGSAQILVERDGRTMLYSGDFCPQMTAAAENIETPKADVLVMECTYGLPQHRFPSRDETTAKLCAFVDAALSAGRAPVLYCYALGKGQEVLRILGQAGYPAAVEEETYLLAKVYEDFGVSFGQYRLLDGSPAPGEVIVTPALSKVGEYLAGRPLRTAAVTGWAVGGHSYRARRADTMIPLSDHADFYELLKYAEAVGPETLYILHGPSEFGLYLKKAGFHVGDLTEKAPAANVT